MEQTKPPRKPVTGNARLLKHKDGREFLTISVDDKEKTYLLKLLDPHPDVAVKAWRLTKAGGTFYDICLFPTGTTCSCPDFTFCREWKDRKGCKHMCGLRVVGRLT